MSKVHKLKIEEEYYKAIVEGRKSFEIRENDRGYRVGDFLHLQEYKDRRYIGNEVMQRVTYVTGYEQKDNYVVMSMVEVPKSFLQYIKMSEKEKAVFKAVVTHLHLYGSGSRDVSNTLTDIIGLLIGKMGLEDEEELWYREYLREE